jgi:hypothetical protein
LEDGVPIAEKKPNHNGKSGCQSSRFFRLIGALSIFNVYVFRFQKILAFWTTAFPMFPYLDHVLRESYEGLFLCTPFSFCPSKVMTDIQYMQFPFFGFHHLHEGRL